MKGFASALALVVVALLLVAAVLGAALLVKTFAVALFW